MKDREYLYTFDVRNGKDDAGVMQWERKEQVATSMVEISRLLKIPLEDLRYLTKELMR